MPTNHHKGVFLATGLGLCLSLLSGCQTWMGGMTLPSEEYLNHMPQYFPQEPDFPLPKELGYQEEKAGLLAPGVGGPVGGPAPVPAGGLPGGR